MGSRFNRHGDALAARHGERVWRLGIDAGFACPHRAGGRGPGGCAFCSPEAGLSPYIRGREQEYRREPVAGQVARAMEFVRRRYGGAAFFPYFQAYSCTNLPAAELAPIYGEALDAVTTLAPGALRGLVVSTRPDCFDSGKATLLGSYAARGLEVWVEFGLQSAHDETLARIGRGHGAAEFARAMSLAGEAGVTGGAGGPGLRRAAHLILGLPGETREMMLESVDFAVRCGIEGVKFHDLRLARGSRLAHEYPAGEIGLRHPSRLPSLLADCIERLPPEVEVMRLTADIPDAAVLDPFRRPDKSTVYAAVEDELARRGTRQGTRTPTRPANP